MQPVASAIVLASLYALLGAGYVLIYRASRVLNLAQGDMMMLAGYALYATATTVSGSPPVAVILAALLSCAAGGSSTCSSCAPWPPTRCSRPSW